MHKMERKINRKDHKCDKIVRIILVSAHTASKLDIECDRRTRGDAERSTGGHNLFC